MRIDGRWANTHWLEPQEEPAADTGSTLALAEPEPAQTAAPAPAPESTATPPQDDPWGSLPPAAIQPPPSQPQPQPEPEPPPPRSAEDPGDRSADWAFIQRHEEFAARMENYWAQLSQLSNFRAGVGQGFLDYANEVTLANLRPPEWEVEQPPAEPEAEVERPDGSEAPEAPEEPQVPAEPEEPEEPQVSEQPEAHRPQDEVGSDSAVDAAPTQVVVITGQALPKDAEGNRYETDATGRQVVHLASGGMLALAASAAVPLAGNLALPSVADLLRLGNAAEALMRWAAVPALLITTPGNWGQGAQRYELNEALRFERRDGEVFGKLYERQGDGEWLARDERYAGYQTGEGFVVLSEEQLARLSGPGASPGTPLPPQPLPPTPALVDGQDPIPGHAAEPESGSGLEGKPAQPPSPDDILIFKTEGERYEAAMQAWSADPSLRHPDDLLGKTDGGPGAWVLSGERSGGAGYQEQISHVPRGIEYEVAGIRFDHFDAARNVLVDSKDWRGYVLPERRFWTAEVVDTASRQMDAVARSGTSASIEWQVSTQAAADAIRGTLASRGIDDIRVVVVPKEGP